MTARTLTRSRSDRRDATLPFALPIGLSAFLLFSVEPLVGRLVLPVFGGTPAVWATILFFFQAVLLARLPVRPRVGHAPRAVGPAVHLALAALGFVALIVAPARSPICGTRRYRRSIDLIRILFALIGLPAFVLTTTTPLVSGWFHAARTEREGDPYWLYALSNARLAARAAGLSAADRAAPRPGRAARGLGGRRTRRSCVLLAVAALRALPDIRAGPRRPRPWRHDAVVVARRRGGPAAARAIDWPRRLRWLLLAAIPSGLLSAVTNVHRHGPRLGAAPVGRPAGDLPRVVHRRVLAARWPGRPARGRSRRRRWSRCCGCPTARPAAGRSS